MNPSCAARGAPRFLGEGNFRLLRKLRSYGLGTHEGLARKYSSSPTDGQMVIPSRLLKYRDSIMATLSERKKPSVRELRGYMYAIVKTKRVREGFKLFEILKAEKIVPDATLVAAMIKLLVSENEGVSALKLYNSYHRVGFTPTIRIFESLCRLYSQRGDIIGFEAMWDHMDKEGVQASPRIFAEFIECCSKAREHKKAEQSFLKAAETFKRMDIGLICSALRMCLRCGRYDMGRNIIDNLGGYKLRPDESILRYKMLLHIAEEQFAEAEKTFEDMVSDRGKVKREVVRVMMSVHGMRKNVSGASDLYSRMAEISESPTIDDFNMLLKTYDQCGDINTLWQRFKNIRDEGLQADAETISTLIIAFSRHSRFENARSIIASARKMGMHFSVESTMFPLKAAAKRHQFDWVKVFLALNKQMLRRPSTSVYAAFAYARTLGGKGKLVLKELEGRGPKDHEILQGVLTAASLIGDEMVMTSALLQLREQRGGVLRRYSLQVAANGFYLLKNFDEVIRLGKEYKKYKTDRNMLSLLLIAYCETDQVQELIDISATIVEQDLHVDPEAYEALCRFHLRYASRSLGRKADSVQDQIVMQATQLAKRRKPMLRNFNKQIPVIPKKYSNLLRQSVLDNLVKGKVETLQPTKGESSLSPEQLLRYMTVFEGQFEDRLEHVLEPDHLMRQFHRKEFLRNEVPTEDAQESSDSFQSSVPS